MKSTNALRDDISKKLAHMDNERWGRIYDYMRLLEDHEVEEMDMKVGEMGAVYCARPFMSRQVALANGITLQDSRRLILERVHTDFHK